MRYRNNERSTGNNEAPQCTSRFCCVNEVTKNLRIEQSKTDPAEHEDGKPYHAHPLRFERLYKECGILPKSDFFQIGDDPLGLARLC